jgi:hypothetical protein
MVRAQTVLTKFSAGGKWACDKSPLRRDPPLGTIILARLKDVP